MLKDGRIWIVRDHGKIISGGTEELICENNYVYKKRISIYFMPQFIRHFAFSVSFNPPWDSAGNLVYLLFYR